MFSNYEIDWLYPIQSLSMSWNQVEELSKEPLCIIGGHTMTHPVFNRLSINDIHDEIYGGINKIETVIHKNIEHFAYPYGSANEVGQREFDYLRTLDFKSVYISHGGLINLNNADFMCMPRYMLKK